MRCLIGLLATTFLSSLLVFGCTSMEPGADEDENLIAPAGKEDNFFSNTAQEYYVKATPTIRLGDSYKGKPLADREARARRIMEGKTKAIAWFLHVYLVDKSSHDTHPDYGGLRAMVLDGSYESTTLRADPEDELVFTYNFTIQIGGTKELLRLIRSDNNLKLDENTFPLKMAKLSNSSVISFHHGSYDPGEWTPATCNCEVEDLPVLVEPIDASPDAYLDVARMLEDGVMDISVHFGWDYHARYDIYHARHFYDWLIGTMKFKSPVNKFEELNRLSGSLTKDITVNGKAIQLKISVFHPDPCVDWAEAGPYGGWQAEVKKDKDYKKKSCEDYKWSDDPKINKEANTNSTTSLGGGHLMKDLKDSLQTRDAIIFTGHSGYTYSYALANWNKTSSGDFDPPELKTFPLPKDKSQLFVVSGCDTYHVGEAFKQNPDKLGLVNADVITTTSFSNSGDLDDTKDIITALVGDRKGALTGITYGKLMSKLNSQTSLPSWDSAFYTMYGVHGIDDNPTANPLGDASRSCETCTRNADCGAVGNVCVRLNDSEKVCAVECVNDSGCGDGKVCRKFGSSNYGYLLGMACVPKSLSCKTAPVVDPTDKTFAASGTVDKNEEKYYEVYVGPTARNIVIKLSGDHDADVYTNFIEKPAVKTYKCRPYKYGSDETCTHKKVSGDTLYVMVRGWAASSAYELNVTWD
ncbi:MAG: PPC domain-containing protein [Deltaproteobacteria bacterium]|nr:PPC domain-containing protein [Deltaproteobacteria bacterium]